MDDQFVYSSIRLEHTNEDNPTTPFNKFIIDEKSPPKEIPNLSKINLFVGSNNSGKSWFMRELAKNENYQFDLKDHSIKNILSTYNDSVNELKEMIRTNKIINANTNSVNVRCANGESFKSYPDGIPLSQFAPEPVDGIIDFYNSNSSFNTLIQSLKPTVCPRYIDLFENDFTLTNSGAESVQVFRDYLVKYESNWRNMQFAIEIWRKKSLKNPNKIYIPILRSLNYFKHGAQGNDVEDLYEKRVRENYFSNIHPESVKIFTGQAIYEHMQQLVSGESQERKRKHLYESFLSKYFFDNKTVSINSIAKDNVVYVEIGDQSEFPIYKLGDGIQSVIIMTYPLFMFDNAMFFIEEPEVHLHPGLQRKFLETLIDFSKPKSAQEMQHSFGHQFFITTHSNHLLDVSMDSDEISIFNFHRKDGRFQIDLVSSGDNNSLRLLGVQNSSVFLANSTIWVEGYTDRIYLKKYLEIFLEDPTLDSKYLRCKNFKEGVHYAFVYTSGDNITSWDFNDEGAFVEYLDAIGISRKSPAKLLCGKAYVIIDNDNNKNHERKEALGRVLFDRLHILDSAEIENLLPYEAILNTILELPYWKNLTISDFPGEDQIDESLFKTKKLGTLLHKHIINMVDPEELSKLDNRRRRFVEKDQLPKIMTSDDTSYSLTDYSKKEFANSAPKFVSRANIREEALNLARSVWDFILDHN